MKPDQKCTELADYFMDEGITADRKHLVRLLAEHIQTEIQRWLEGLMADIARDEEDAA